MIVMFLELPWDGGSGKDYEHRANMILESAVLDRITHNRAISREEDINIYIFTVSTDHQHLAILTPTPFGVIQTTSSWFLPIL